MNIVDFFDRINNGTIQYCWLLKRFKVDSIIRKVTQYAANVILPLYYTTTKTAGLNCDELHSNNVIVSLTSFPARIGRVHLTIESIMRQTVRPDKIILWLSRKQFPDETSLPHKLLKLKKRGVTVKFVDEDIKSHKKYYYALKEYPDATIITVDDDIFYRTDMIATLVRYSNKYPESIIANYALKIKYNQGTPAPYKEWIGSSYLNQEKGFDVFFGSGGGTLFKPGFLNEMACNKDVFLQICPSADDVWLNAMSRINGHDVVKTDYHSILLPVLSNSPKLNTKNISAGHNDIQIEAVRSYCMQLFEFDPFQFAH